jgi:hypothetical protein
VCANVLKEELRIYFKIHNVSNIIFNDSEIISISILNKIYKKGLQYIILPQICICLRILSTIPTSLSTGERSFGKLKLIKSFLRSTTEENRLNHLILLKCPTDFFVSFEKAHRTLQIYRPPEKLECP